MQIYRLASKDMRKRECGERVTMGAGQRKRCGGQMDEIGYKSEEMREDGA